MFKPRTWWDRLNHRIFRAVHENQLVYNTCWEDPAVDRQALQLSASDKVLVITSAGCNALDYLLAGAGEVHAVDVNPIQNALLEFKKASVLSLSHGEFFSLFGEGMNPEARTLYQNRIRDGLSVESRKYWDKNIKLFLGRGWRKSFYYRGAAGFLAKILLTNACLFQRLKKPLEELLASQSMEAQVRVYEDQIKPRIWTWWMKWFLSRNLTLSLMGVPGPQKELITRQYPGGVPQYIQDSIEPVVTQIPFRDNYFYRVYIQGKYTPNCCPEYLKEENFEKLRCRLGDLHIHTNTITGFLNSSTIRFSKFVLLDHMDWMSSNDPLGLADEWTALLQCTVPGARAIFRSAGLRLDYLDQLQVSFKGAPLALGELLRFNTELAARLHPQDRVHTYASFHIADLPE